LPPQLSRFRSFVNKADLKSLNFMVSSGCMFFWAGAAERLQFIGANYKLHPPAGFMAA
jgi:hypothetical protein